MSSVSLVALGSTPVGELPKVLWPALVDSVVMTGVSFVLSVLIGIPLALILVVSAPDGLRPSRLIYAALGWVVNVGRSLPFIILLIALIPVTRMLVGTAIGVAGALVPLTVGGAAYFARLAEAAIREVPRDVVDVALASGSTLWQTARKVLLPEALPGLLSAATVLAVGTLAFSAMAGAVGAGGLGDLAIAYGYLRFDNTVTFATVILLIVIVQVVQVCGDLAVRIASAHR
ncbi:methionine ABC transporter permease [Mycolicibacterium porcinum]|uniref:ABC transporter permease n=1 Tax=Mycolicibacterium porcinum TaxID=39693 RepID=A0AAW5T6A6_9MYCO|nr:methionine ABC transporter permease [Mycolicibacterium porcinum]MCV7390429.1 ABC transporter permease [Mycolicibacterium porcinum]ORB36188.1 metal ABC transporter permease [Mycolicibacterium porcinum]TVX97186.1 ABC transporter permease [Mycolicibacterium porcinum]CDO31019.1 binding-protein-dependent transport system inner membrane protein [Mycolicibacterium vulneris]